MGWPKGKSRREYNQVKIEQQKKEQEKLKREWMERNNQRRGVSMEDVDFGDFEELAFGERRANRTRKSTFFYEEEYAQQMGTKGGRPKAKIGEGNAIQIESKRPGRPRKEKVFDDPETFSAIVPWEQRHRPAPIFKERSAEQQQMEDQRLKEWKKNQKEATRDEEKKLATERLLLQAEIELEKEELEVMYAKRKQMLKFNVEELEREIEKRDTMIQVLSQVVMLKNDQLERETEATGMPMELVLNTVALEKLLALPMKSQTNHVTATTPTNNAKRKREKQLVHLQSSEVESNQNTPTEAMQNGKRKRVEETHQGSDSQEITTTTTTTTPTTTTTTTTHTENGMMNRSPNGEEGDYEDREERITD